MSKVQGHGFWRQALYDKGSQVVHRLSTSRTLHQAVQVNEPLPQVSEASPQSSAYGRALLSNASVDRSNLTSTSLTLPTASPHITSSNTPISSRTTPVASSHATIGIKSNLLLMTCHVMVVSPGGLSVEARALLDSGSSTSFISQQLVCLQLPRSRQSARISGVAGIAKSTAVQSIAKFAIHSVHSADQWWDVSAVIAPHVTCDLPLHSVSFNEKWSHFSDITLADPDFGSPSRIDLLLGVDVFVDVVCPGRLAGPSGSLTAFETAFGWVLAGSTGPSSPTHQVSHHVLLLTGDDILRKFWGIEEKPCSVTCLHRRSCCSSLQRQTPSHLTMHHSFTNLLHSSSLNIHLHAHLIHSPLIHPIPYMYNSPGKIMGSSPCPNKAISFHFMWTSDQSQASLTPYIITLT